MVGGSLLSAEVGLLAILFPGLLALLLLGITPPPEQLGSSEGSESDASGDPLRGLASVGPKDDLLAVLYDDRLVMRDTAGCLQDVLWVKSGDERVVVVAGTRSHSLVAVGQSDGLVRLLDTQTHQLRFSRQIDDLSPRGIAFSPAGTLLAVTGDTGLTIVFSVETGEELWRRLMPLPAQAVQFVDDDRIALAADRRILVLDSATGQMLDQFEGPNAIMALAVLDGGAVVAGLVSGEVLVWEPGHAASARFRRTDATAAMSLVALPGGGVAMGDVDGSVRLLDPQTLNVTACLTGHSRSVSDLCTCGGRLVSGSHDGTVRVWEVSAGAVALQ